MSETAFKLPPIAPDFALMTRDRLETYAAEADYQLRGLIATQENLSDDILKLRNAFRIFYPSVRTEFSRPSIKILVRLMEGQATKNQLMDAVYWDSREARGIKNIDVFICKLRPFMAALGCPIITLWGSGYEIESRDRFSQIIAEFKDHKTIPDLIERDNSETYTAGGALTPAAKAKIRQALKSGLLSRSEIAAAFNVPRHRVVTQVQLMAAEGWVDPRV